MKKTFVIALAAILSVAGLSASAQSRHTLHKENRRIAQGIKSGELTVAEAKRLSAQELHIRNEAYRYKNNDGHIGPVERADLRRDERKLSHHIYRQKHDRQTRF